MFVALGTKIEKTDRSVIVKMDDNAKLGKKYIKYESHNISSYGTILAEIVERQKIGAGNGKSMCQGSITRKEVTKKKQKRVL